MSCRTRPTSDPACDSTTRQEPRTTGNRFQKNGQPLRHFLHHTVEVRKIWIRTAVPRHSDQDVKGTMSAAVLLIDDNAIQAAARQTILRRADYFVIAALNPVRALEQFQKNEFPEEIGLVITDHIMPGMSGAEFVRELRKTHPALPVLVISGLEEAEEEYDGLNVIFKLKPLRPDLLLAQVQDLLATK
jgi:CheY-like chemotaxis protein